MRSREDIADDDPITLETASKVVLRGAVTVSTLRAEIKRGNLGVLRIGKNLFTTPADIREMKNRCRVQLSRQDSTSEQTAGERSGSSATKDATDELAALKGIATALTNGSLSTFSKRTAASQRRAGDPIPFPSRR
jgi:hypothetical protein